MSGRAIRLVALLAALCALLVVGVANASAAKVYVSTSAPAKAGGKTCVEPTYNTVSAALIAGAATVEVCPGTYTEQLTIVKAVKLVAADGAGTATVALPAGAGDSTTACDTKEGLEQIDEVSICTPGKVTISGLDVRALIPLETCAKGLNGIFVGEGTLKASNLTVDGASTTLNSFKGCQHGIAISVGSIEPLEVAKATLTKVTSEGYQKNGPTVSGEGSSLTMTSSKVEGEGPSPYTGQNGVQIAFGAKGTIKTSEITGNECELAMICGATGEQASGVLFYQAAEGSTLTNSHVDENDLGVYYSAGSETAPSSPLVFSGDELTSNRYEGLFLEEGEVALKKLKINGSGRVGVEINQYEGEAKIEASATSTKISGQSEAAIKVTSDKAAGDTPGTFRLTNSTATAPVLINESNNYVVVF